MTEHEFTKLIEYMWPALWPKSAEPTAHQCKIMFDSARSYTLQDATLALECHAAESRFAPSPADLISRMPTASNERSRDKERYERASTWADHCREVKIQINHRDQTFSAMSEDDRERHKVAAMNDWRLDFLKNRPTDCVAWKWHIYRRVQMGLSPDQASETSQGPFISMLGNGIEE